MLDSRVLILSASPETLDSVQAYLLRVGATALAVSRLEDASRLLLESDAIVLFADDYGKSEVLSALASFAARRCVVVTSEVETYRNVERSRVLRDSLVVLQRPAWGWVLLDALRADGARQGV